MDTEHYDEVYSGTARQTGATYESAGGDTGYAPSVANVRGIIGVSVAGI
jgi:hypothetical protein